MILFKAIKTEILLDNQICDNLCETLNKKYEKEFHLSHHPNENNIISIKVTDNKPAFVIEECCCDEFKKDLENTFRHLKVG